MTDADRRRVANDDADRRTAELLERTFAARAEDAPRGFGLAGRARAARRRRIVRRGLGAGAALAAAAVLAAIGIPLVWSESDQKPDTSVAAGLPPVDRAPQGYRWESTRGVEFLVPAGWQYGVSGEVPCAGAATSEPAGEVGLSRAVTTAIGCANDLPVSQRPPHVWIDFAPATPATADYGNGLIEQGRAVGGVIVSVLSDDVSVRSEVLNSVRSVGSYDANGCAPSDPIASNPAARPADAGGLPDDAAVTSVALCLYQLPSQLEETTTTQPLLASSRLDSAAGAALVAAVRAAPFGIGPDDDPASCLDPYGDAAILIRVGTDGGVAEAYLRYAGCVGRGIDDGTAVRQLTRDVFAALWPAELMRPTVFGSDLAPLVEGLL